MNKKIRFNYRNYKGNVSLRTVVPDRIYFGSTEQHKEEQWIMLAWDVDKEQDRAFAIRDIYGMEEAEDGI